MALAVVWISLPNLSRDLFAKKSLLSITSAIGKPIAIDKSTQIKSRPSMTRIKVILDLMEKLPNRIRGTINSEKYQGDVREISNEKRKIVDVDQSKSTSLDRQLVAATSEQNRVDSMHVDTTTNKVQSKEVVLNLMSNATKNARGTPRVRVDAPRVGSGQKLMDLGQKLMDTYDVEDTTGNLVRLTKNDNDLIQEKRVSPLALNSKLSPEAPIFLPKCVIEKKNVSRDLVSNTIDLGEDSLDEDEEDNMLDICFDRVAREGDISPRQQSSGSNKRKNKTHGRQHSWDGKLTVEFFPRQLPMRQVKQNHLTISIGSTRSKKPIKKELGTSLELVRPLDISSGKFTLKKALTH
ncbi:hypothetical protein H5410_002300 [Solanum commersonii]|uniref:DUF4283 domain-containing protein n=1 Tax=Solanum commersonii TaxID=4109 RepID=A0A9J6B2H6_SOLCO|nr:hypothetical protein H5410_002300 [Solanum commersonii]